MLSFILQGQVVYPLQTLKMSSRTLKSYLVEILTKYWHIIDIKNISLHLPFILQTFIGNVLGAFV